MTMRLWVSLVSATLLGSTIPYAADAEEQFVICVKDWVGCQANYFVSCGELRADPAMRAKADQICKQERGYSNAGVYQVGKSTSGGECGTYKFVVTCR
jgi:hypothetical protein